jgi:arylsulfatase A-like enzyme
VFATIAVKFPAPKGIAIIRYSVTFNWALTLSISLCGFSTARAAEESPGPGVSVPTPAAASRIGADRRNLLLIVIDDLRPELGVYGGQAISPTLDRLASEGVRFDRAYTPISICNPARSSIFTGKHPDTLRVYNNDVTFRDTLPDVVTLPQYFKHNGYRTEYYGKVFHDKKRDVPSWDAGAMGEITVWNLEKNKALNAIEGQRGPAYEKADVPDDAYPEGRVTIEGLGALERLAEGDQPFFLALGYIKPHLPFNAPSRYWDLYDADSLELTDQPDPAEGQPAVAGYDSGELKSYYGIPENIADISNAEARNMVHGYLACISYVDEQVQQVLNKLDELGLADNTAVVVWGDHGYKLGDQASWAKQSNFEIDTRVPLIFRVPWLSAKGVVGQNVGLLDLYPTLTDLFELQRPAGLHGESFFASLQDPSHDDGRVILSQIRRGGAMGYSIRLGQYRYTRWQQGDAVVAEELYDHSVGAAARVNLVQQPEMAADVQRLAARLDAEIAEGQSVKPPEQHWLKRWLQRVRLYIFNPYGAT